MFYEWMVTHSFYNIANQINLAYAMVICVRYVQYASSFFINAKTTRFVELSKSKIILRDFDK